MESKVWIIVGIVCIIILVGYVYAYDFFSVRTIIEKGISKIEEAKIKANIIECPKEIIPQRMYLNGELLHFQNYTEHNGKEVLMGYSSIGKWADGQEMDLLGSDFKSICYQGSYEGENINLVYCNGVGYSKSTTAISKEGIVGETKIVSYLVDLVLEKESVRYLDTGLLFGNYQITTYKVISSKCVKQ